MSIEEKQDLVENDEEYIWWQDDPRGGFQTT
jgi:hypothetical protein